jgi:outer membrane protein
MKIRSLLLLLIFFIFFSKISLSHEKTIVYIDLNKIMNNSIAGKSITSQLENNHKKNILKFKNIEEELKKEEAEIISQKNIITKEEFEKKIIDLRDKANKFRKERNDNINNLNNQRLEATSKMITLVRPILSEFSDKNSISLIIDKKNIIIGKTLLDITDDILKIIDEKIGKIQLD